MSQTDTAEAYIVDRYKLWQNWQTRYDYKRIKGTRIAQILARTGGMAKLAVEVGVGPGGVAATLSRHGLKVIGIDLSPDALVRAKEHCRTDNVSLLRGSGFSLPFPDGSLELIYASQVLHLFDTAGRLALMGEANRVLQPSGRFVFDMKNAASHPVRYFTSSPERRRRNFPTQGAILDLLRQSRFDRVTRWPGVLPLLASANVPNISLFRQLAHTTFFVATPRS